MEKTPLMNLALEICEHIAFYLDGKDLLSLISIDSFWRTVYGDKSFWKSKVLNINYYNSPEEWKILYFKLDNFSRSYLFLTVRTPRGTSHRYTNLWESNKDIVSDDKFIFSTPLSLYSVDSDLYNSYNTILYFPITMKKRGLLKEDFLSFVGKWKIARIDNLLPGVLLKKYGIGGSYYISKKPFPL